MKTYDIPQLPLPYDLETVSVLKQLSMTSRRLAELKGVAATIPNEQILISTLTLQEAKDSSAVENIVTTQDDLYRATSSYETEAMSAATKEVLNYREALQHGFEMVRKNKLLTNRTIKEIQELIEHNKAGFRKVSGTKLKRQNNESEESVVYMPPQDPAVIESLMADLERFINDESLCNSDPLIKMAIIHHQFESIHPFYNGNGRTGRIVNVLYLVINDLLDLPILYLSRYITRYKDDYYRLLQAIRDKNTDNAKEWEEWILFMLKGVEVTAIETIELVKGISELMRQFKAILRHIFGHTYKHELINNLFFHPYTKIDYFKNDLQISRQTASRYLDLIVKADLLEKIKIGRENYYVNKSLMNLFIFKPKIGNSSLQIESV